MFGFVSASLEELSEEQKNRYQAVYCGICRAIRSSDGQLCRLALSYDMAFLALLLMSLYEPEETTGRSRCIAHPGKRRPWTDNEYIRYAARMNVALACFKARDDWEDEGKYSAKLMAQVFGKNEETIAAVEAVGYRQFAEIYSLILSDYINSQIEFLLTEAVRKRKR